MKRITVRYMLLVIILALVSLFYQFTPDPETGFSEFSLHRKIVGPSFIQSPGVWADSVLNSLKMDERIAQMLMVAAYSNQDEVNEREIRRLIRSHNIGGLVFFQGTPYHQAELTNYYQSIAKTPLFIAMDAEWGLGMRLDSTISYPRQMMLGAIRNESLIYETGVQIAEQLKRIGVQINFAPVADVNNNPDNPVINSRSFGEDRANVSSKALLYMKGMQDNKILAVAKHFPGHGDTDVDSHNDLPLIRHSADRLDSLELFPFKELIYSGISGIMSAHLQIPAIDSTNNTPSSLSGLVIDSLLKNTIGFKGLVFTDAMNMNGITNYFTSAEAVEKAVLAGNDILVMPQDIPLTIRTISRMIRNGLVSEDEITSRCRKILLAKYWCGLNDYQTINLQGIQNDLSNERYQLLHRKLIESSLTVLSNRDNLLPFRNLDTLSIVSVAFGEAKDSAFQKTLCLYLPVKQHHIRESSQMDSDNLYRLVQNYDVVIASMHSNDIRATRQYGISDHAVETIENLALKKQVVLNLFGNPYLLNRFEHPGRFRAVIISYENAPLVQDLTAQMMFGAMEANGMLPVSAGQWSSLLSGIQVQGVNRLKYSIPAEAGMSQDSLQKIDEIIDASIADQMMPGCQVMVIRNGIVVLNKAYGSHEYSGRQEVKTSDLYDLASVTKAAATIPVIMKLYDEGIIDINRKLSDYLPNLKRTEIKSVTIKDILLHQAGLKAWIPFYHKLLEPVFYSQSLFNDSIDDMNSLRIGARQYINRYTQYSGYSISNVRTEQYPLQVAENIFIGKNWSDSIYSNIANTPLNGKKEYLYSDLGFYILKIMLDSLTGNALDKLADAAFYKKLGAARLCFNPLDRYSKEEVTPTEEDQYFRKQLVHGFVHDPGAAMMGGVSGHAGLFSNANDLAKLFQMFLNEGEYAGDRYIESETLNMFTSGSLGVKDNRRGLGFDKPEADTSKPGPTCWDASSESYGHSGFTGTLVWNDPAYNLIYIFLSNRVFPDATNNKLVEMNIRTNIQQVVYSAIIDRKPIIAGKKD